MARKAIESGEALAKMKLFVEKTKELGGTAVKA